MKTKLFTLLSAVALFVLTGCSHETVCCPSSFRVHMAFKLLTICTFIKF